MADVSPSALTNRSDQALAAEVEALRELLARRTKELERTRSQLRSIVDHAPHYIQILDQNLIMTWANRVPEGYEYNEVVGHKAGHITRPHVRRKLRQRLQEVLQTGNPANYEYPVHHKDGSVSWWRASAGPIVDDKGTGGIVVIVSDATEDQRRIDALRQGKREAESARIRDKALLNSIGEGLFVIDEQGKVSNINPAALAMLGYEREEIMGQWFPGLVKAVDETGHEVDPMKRPAMQALSEGKVITESVYYRRKDGTHFPVSLTISPVVIGGKPVGAIEVFRDLTQERELEAAKEEFVSLASHQLRTPATGVKAYISMLLDGYAGDLTERQREFIQKVHESNERQLEIVNDMLNVARLDAGGIIPEMVSTDVKKLAQDVIDEQRQSIREHHQDLEVTMPTGRVEYVLDPKLIRMAFENILNNASKYTPEGGTITVRVGVSGGWLELSVADTGVGIAKADIPKLFKRFSRIDNPLSAVRGGSGLGLYLSQTIVLLHGGRLTVDSAIGKGTTFSIELPLRRTEPSNGAST